MLRHIYECTGYWKLPVGEVAGRVVEDAEGGWDDLAGKFADSQR